MNLSRHKQLVEKAKRVRFFLIAIGLHWLVILLLSSITFRFPTSQREDVLVTVRLSETELEIQPEEIERKLFKNFDAEVSENMTIDSPKLEVEEIEVPEDEIVSDEVFEKETLTEDMFTDLSQLPMDGGSIGKVATIGIAGGSRVGAPVRVRNYKDATGSLGGSISGARRGTKPMLIIWLVDESASMADDRQAVKERIGVIYERLGAEKAKGVRMTVVGFGSNVHILNRPTNNVQQLQVAMDAVPVDSTGVERPMFAVRECIQKLRGGGHDCVIVIMTDERGDDVDQLEETIKLVRKTGTLIFVMGRESSVDGHPVWEYGLNEDGKREGNWISRGSDSAVPEVMIPYHWAFRPNRSTRSGFGSYAMTRLAQASGGVLYLIANESKYNWRILSSYAPEICSQAEYESRLKTQPLRRQLAEIRDWAKTALPRHHYGPTPDGARTAAIADLKKVKAGMPKLDSYIKKLARLDTAAINRAESKRWQAIRDVTRAQMMKVRWQFKQYQFMASEFIKRKDLKTLVAKNTKERRAGYCLLLGGKIQGGEQVHKEREEVCVEFDRIIERHSRTPWATLLTREKKYIRHMEIRPHEWRINVKRPKL